MADDATQQRILQRLEALEAEYQKLKSATASTAEPTKTAANN